MALSKKVNIRYQVDSRSAKRGLEEISKGTEDVRRSTTKTTAQFRDFDAAVRRASKNQRTLRSTFGGASKGAQAFEGALGGLSSTLGRAGAGGVVGGIVAAGAALKAFNEIADAVAKRSLEVSAVFANVPIPIEAARRQTRGLVTDFDLARLASDAVSLGVTDNAKKFADLSEALQKLGARRGIDALKSIEDGFSAIGRQETELLDNLGITLKISQAQEEYARILGKTTKELSANEKAEAFREVATRKVIEAAKGVTIDTDGAAAAVRRFNVELQNIKDQAVGGSAATLSLAEGLQKLQSEKTIDVDAIKRYGAASADLKIQLRDLGVASKDIPADIDKLAKAARSAAIDVKRFQYEEDQRQKALEKTPAYKAEQARLAAEKESLETARLRIKEIEEEEAFLSANNDQLAQKAKLQIESLLLQAKIVRATGDEAKALQIERQAFLADLREQSRIANEGRSRRGGGRRRDPYLQERLAFQQQLTESLNAERKREFEGAVTLQRGYLRDVQRFESELAAARQPEIDRAKLANEQLERQAGLQAAALQREIEMAQVRGQSLQVYALEQQAFDAREASLRRQLELTNEVGQREQLQDELAQVRHERTIARINEEARLRQESQQRITTAINSVSAAERGALQLSTTIAGAAIQGEQRKKKVLDGIKAAGLYADGAVSIAQGGIALAAGNIPQGIAMIAAGANAIAQGTVIAAGNAGPGGGSRGGGGAGSATQFSRGEAPQRAQFNVERGAPISVREGIEGNPNNTGQSGAGSSGARVINIQRIDVLGSIDDDSANKIRRGLARAEANLGV